MYVVHLVSRNEVSCYNKTLNLPENGCLNLELDNPILYKVTNFSDYVKQKALKQLNISRRSLCVKKQQMVVSVSTHKYKGITLVATAALFRGFKSHFLGNSLT